MRIALTNPYCWPQVRRGSERLLHDLSHYLTRRGHAVTIISSAPGPRTIERDGDVRRILVEQRALLPWRNRWLTPFHRFGLQVRREVLDGGFDAVHCLNYHDAFGALLARRHRGGMRVVFQMAGIALRRVFRTIPHDAMMFRHVIGQADAVLTVSGFAQATLRAQFGRDSQLLPSPTDIGPYLAMPKPLPGGALQLLFVGDANEARKGAVLLARAFALLRRHHADMRLDYSGHADRGVMAAIRAAVPPADQDAITFHDVGAVADLPGLYARASVFVNPAVWEAQGMVLVEALASGTPVVGCNHAGIPDIISDPAIGRMFEPGAIVGHAATDHVALAGALAEAAELAGRPETAARCRAHAVRFGWARLGPAYESAITGLPLAACTPTPAGGQDAMADAAAGGP